MQYDKIFSKATVFELCCRILKIVCWIRNFGNHIKFLKKNPKKFDIFTNKSITTVQFYCSLVEWPLILNADIRS